MITFSCAFTGAGNKMMFERVSCSVGVQYRNGRFLSSSDISK